MNENDISAFLQTTGDALQALFSQSAQLSAHLQQMQAQQSALLYLTYALAKTHPNAAQLADTYMALMDQAADRLSPQQTAHCRDAMNTVLQELLTILSRPGE